ncbi:MAG TPA: AraC family transcriptional regulator [Anaerolineales bacterium]|nr:AraC family transcriptional regulator [Anaerolineales bacterium]
MILQIHKPAFPLNKFIEHLVYYDGLRTTHSLDRFLPDGNTEIIIDLTEQPQYIYDNETLQEIQACRYAWVSGVRTQPITIPSGHGSRMLIVAFKKGGAFPFYSFPMSTLTDTVVEADFVFGTEIHHLREQLLTVKSSKRMFQLMESFLLHQAGEAIDDSISTRSVQHALMSIVHSPTIRCLHELSEQIGYSQKHFIDLFKAQVGVSPKQYLKIMRFQKAVWAIERDALPRWSQIALESGYYDQAHLIHDFKLFSGFTPNEYVKRKASLLNYIPVG